MFVVFWCPANTQAGSKVYKTFALPKTHSKSGLQGDAATVLAKESGFYKRILLYGNLFTSLKPFDRNGFHEVGL